jgi:N-acetylglucosamine transport system substrate-binding protein
MTEIFGTRAELDRRTLLRRAGAVGLLAIPAVSMLSACVGDSSDDTSKQSSGTKSADNPLGIDPKAPTEIIIFNGGLGTAYSTDVDTPLYNKKWPDSKITYSQTETISTVVQPRINAGSPPDMIDNSGSNLMDMGALVAAGQAQDLTDLFAAPSWDIPGKKVSETLTPGTIEQGTYSGKPYALNYSYTVYGLWYDAKLFAKNSWTPPKTWDEFTALSDKIKAAGITPFGYGGANASYYMVRALMTSIAKLGGPDVLKSIDNLEAGAWQNPAVKQAATAWGAYGQKYTKKEFLGLRHTEIQLQQNQDKVAFYPCGSWLENEQAKDTPKTFEYAVTPVPSLTTSDKLPPEAINAAAGEIYFVAAKGKNPRGGMEYLRAMLAKEAALGFTKLTKSLTVVAGAADGVTISPGLTAADGMLKAAGSNVFVGYLFDAWYKAMDDESRSAINELMYQGGTPDKFVSRMQAVADKVKGDSSITKFTR